MVDIKVEKYLDVGGSKRKFSFESLLEKHTILGVYGPSGCGKTSLLKIIAGLLEPDFAKISIGEEILTDTQKGIDKSIDKRGVAMVFQDQSLFPNMTVEEHIDFINKGFEGVEVEDLLLRFKLNNHRRTYPDKLSGGQKQRLAILLAILSRPKFLVLDEPFTALDDETRNSVSETLKDYLERMNLPVLIVSHQVAFLHEFCTQLIKLSNL
jgi:molybdate transport system ATP-binding protein